MPDGLMQRFPHVLNQLEAVKLGIGTGTALVDRQFRMLTMGLEMTDHQQRLGRELMRLAVQANPWSAVVPALAVLDLWQERADKALEMVRNHISEMRRTFLQAREGELEFLDLFAKPPEPQCWETIRDHERVLLDLPGMRVLDFSAPGRHRLRNYTVVFAPRAGHHSNIAERVAVFLRDQGLSRMAVVEQKCAAEVPLYVEGRRHREGFEGQVAQYRRVLEDLRERTGAPAHLVAVCQPGPLLMSTLILYPELGRTFGSAGSPMDTEAAGGFLTDYARTLGPGYIDMMLLLFGMTVPGDQTGAGRQTYDGSLQVLGFYLLGMQQHMRNFRRLLEDLRHGKREAARRQKSFYHWYNTVHHFPAGFIRDTYKKIFIRNELARGRLRIGGRRVQLADYPAHVPLWALGGRRDDIAPLGQAIGHMRRIGHVPPENRLTLTCEGGHMALFRSRRVLETYYTRIARFLLRHSDR